MKIGNTTYNVEVIKGMSFETFSEKFKGIINTDLKQTYFKLTGKDGQVKEVKPKVKTVSKPSISVGSDKSGDKSS
jgi:hypothetical protein